VGWALGALLAFAALDGRAALATVSGEGFTGQAPLSPATGEARVVVEQASAAVFEGRFRQAQDRIRNGLPAASPNSTLQTLTELIDAYCTLADRREKLRQGRYDELAAEVKSYMAKGEWAEAAKTGARAYLSAANREEFRDEPWVRDLVRDTSEHADQLRRRGEWLAAATIYASLSEIDPDNQVYEEQFRVCGKHARLEAMYGGKAAQAQDQPDEGDGADQPTDDGVEVGPMDWRFALRGAKPVMVRQALDQIGLNYVRQPGFKEVAAGGLENLLILAETPAMAAVFETIGQPELVGQFTGGIRSFRAGLDQETFVNSRQVYNWFSELLELNRRTLELPEELLAVEFMDGALEPLDDFSSVVWPQELSEFKKHTTGQFSGVGIQISLEKGQLTVVSPLEDTPAYQAGIQPGDTIVGIEGKSTKGITLTKAVQTITGPAGTQVTLTIRREGVQEDFDVPLTRANITIHTVKGYARGGQGGWDYMIDPDQRIAYVRLTSFNEHTTDELRATLELIKAQDTRGLVLDLRFNPGGLLRTAVEVADLFLDGGKMIVKTKGRPAVSPEWSQTANQGEVCPGLPLIVLVNRASASASEIVAGAIQDNRRGLVIGQRSYGKGSVQNLVPLSDGSAYLKLTTAFYYLPSGRCIDRQQRDHQEWGVDPDIPVVLIPEETRKVLELRRDSDILRGRADAAASGRPPDVAATQPSKAVGGSPATTTQEADDVPDVDPQLETALLVMRVKLASGLAWELPEASTASVGIAHPTN